MGLLGVTGLLSKGDLPIICGGFDGNVTDSCECFTLKDGDWESMPRLNECRRWPASSIVSTPQNEDLLVVAGGYRYGSGHLSSVESFDGNVWNDQKIADLPQPVWTQCLVKLNDSSLLSIGGFNGIFQDSTFFYDGLSNSWIAGPVLNVPRCCSGCAVVKWLNPSTNQRERVVVVAGGWNGTDRSDVVELLFIDDISTGWIAGPSLPLSANHPTLIEFQDSVVLIGGYGGVDGKHLYQLNSPTEKWIEMKQTLKERRSDSIAFLIPDELTDCNES